MLLLFMLVAFAIIWVAGLQTFVQTMLAAMMAGNEYTGLELFFFNNINLLVWAAMGIAFYAIARGG